MHTLPRSLLCGRERTCLSYCTLYVVAAARLTAPMPGSCRKQMCCTLGRENPCSWSLQILSTQDQQASTPDRREGEGRCCMRHAWVLMCCPLLRHKLLGRQTRKWMSFPLGRGKRSCRSLQPRLVQTFPFQYGALAVHYWVPGWQDRICQCLCCLHWVPLSFKISVA